jgi:hypothetical protein
MLLAFIVAVTENVTLLLLPADWLSGHVFVTAMVTSTGRAAGSSMNSCMQWHRAGAATAVKSVKVHERGVH